MPKLACTASEASGRSRSTAFAGRSQVAVRRLLAVPDRLQDVLDEEPHELLRDRRRVLVDRARHGERMLEGDAELAQLPPRLQQGRRGHLPGVVAGRPQEPDALRLRDQLRVERAAEDALEPGGVDRLGLLAAERLEDGLLKLERLPAAAAGTHLDQPLDRLQVEALSLHLLDQPDPGQVLRPVVAGPGTNDGRGQQSARLMGADVARRHPALECQLVDRHLVAL